MPAQKTEGKKTKKKTVKGEYQLWVNRGGMKRKLARVLHSCGPNHAEAWASARAMTGVFHTLLAKRNARPAPPPRKTGSRQSLFSRYA